MKPLAGNDLVVQGDWIEIAHNTFVVARVAQNRLGLIDLMTGQRWAEPTDDCGSFPNGGTPLTNFCVGTVDEPKLVKPGPSRWRAEGGDHGR